MYENDKTKTTHPKHLLTLSIVVRSCAFPTSTIITRTLNILHVTDETCQIFPTISHSQLRRE